MKTKIWFFASLIALTAISAFAGGVAVGNGKRLYRSPFGFSVQFEKDLALEVASNSSFRISNAPFVKTGEKISKVEFSVSRGEVTTLDGVERAATQEHPNLRFQEARQPGAEGLSYEARSAETFTAFYYFLTSNGDYIRISLTAFTGANGINWVAPIVGTLTYDVTAPVIHEIDAPKGNWPVGTARTFRFHITDDNSGVLARSSMIWFTKVENGVPIPRKSFFSFNSLVADGNDWYSVSVTPNRFLPPGDYVMDMGVNDKASNGAHLTPPSDNSGLYEGTSLPVVRYNVLNAGAVDTTPPLYEGFRLSSGPWMAGSFGKLFIHASDSVSGIDVSKVHSIGLVSDFEIGHAFYTDLSRNPKDEGDGWYSVELPLDPYLPSGSYHVQGFSVTNGAGLDAIFMDVRGTPNYESDTDQAGPPLIHVIVQNDLRPDVTAPKLLDLRLDTTAWRTGGTYRLHFRATDEGSGMYVSSRGDGPSLHGYFKPVDGTDSTIFIDQAIESEGNDWYGIDVPVSSFIQGRDYYLDNFDVTDKAGNWATYACEEKPSTPTCTNSNGLALPQLRVSVTR